jgi:hypothetical protein
MDKITKYQGILETYLKEYVASRHSRSSIENKVIIDRNNQSFQLLRVGWRGDKYVFAVIIHFDIKDGKIWLQCNNTENEIVDELMAKGVAREDIVLGFQPPYARQYSGFSIA